MNFQYTKYKEMLTNIIDHIERGDKKFPSYDDLAGHYCDEGIQYHNYACDYAYKNGNRMTDICVFIVLLDFMAMSIATIT